MNPAMSDFYVLGGTLPRDARSYVVRRADGELLDSLRHGQFCYVLTSRQMGKSSLMVRAATRLRQEQIACVVLDLTSVGRNLTEEQWYDGLLNRLAIQLELEDELDAFWLSHSRLGPLQRWMQALKSVVLAHQPGPIILFVDEIDAVRSLPFSADEFFAAIRECYNRRTEDPEYARLTFCLLGVATPADLIREARSTPFNIGVRIELMDFTPEEALSLASGFNPAHTNEPMDTEALLKRVFYWTGGHPYLTQRLCAAVAERIAAAISDPDTRIRNPDSLVDPLCEASFLSPGARSRDDNLLFVRERLLRSDLDRAGLLDLYGLVLAGKRVKDDETNPLLSTLRLAGIVRVNQGDLRVRNRIYARVFNRDWIRANMPDAELRRQKMAYRRGFVRAVTISSFIITLISGLAAVAIRQSAKAHAYAVSVDTELNREYQAAEMTWRYLYDANLNLAQQAWNDHDFGRVRELLDECQPVAWNHDEPVYNGNYNFPLRLQLVAASQQKGVFGFEWYLLWRRGHFDLPFLPLQSAYVWSRVAYSADGKVLRTDDGHGLVTYFDAQTGEILPQSANRLLSVGFHHDPFSGTESHGGQDHAVSPDGKSRAEGRHYSREDPEFRHSTVTLRDAKTGALLHSLKGAMGVFAFSPDSKMLATESNSGAVLLWDTATGAQIGAFDGAMGPLAFSPDGTRLVAGTNAYGWGIKLYDIATPREPRSLDRTADSAAISAQGNLLATLDRDWKGVTLWDPSSLQPLRRLPGATDPVAVSPDGTVVATAMRGAPGRLILWNASTGQKQAELPIDSDWEDRIEFSPDGKLLATGSRQGVKLWDVSTRKVVRTLPRGTREATFSGNGKLLVVSAQRPNPGDPTQNTIPQVVLYDVASGRKVRTIEPAHSPVAFSPDGRTVATGTDSSGTIVVWDIASGSRSSVLRGLRSALHACAFSPDGMRLAAGDGSEYNVMLWDMATGREVFHIPGKTDRDDVASYSLFFSPDGMRLYSGNRDGQIRVWDGRPAQ